MRDPVDEHGPVQSCAGGVAAVHGIAAAGAAIVWLVGNVWVGIGKRELAGIRGADFEWSAAERGAEWLGQRIFAFGLPGRAMSQRRRSGVVYQ